MLPLFGCLRAAVQTAPDANAAAETECHVWCRERSRHRTLELPQTRVCVQHLHIFCRPPAQAPFRTRGTSSALGPGRTTPAPAALSAMGAARPHRPPRRLPGHLLLHPRPACRRRRCRPPTLLTELLTAASRITAAARARRSASSATTRPAACSRATGSMTWMRSCRRLERQMRAVLALLC